ncbi:hypothetical protein D3OALGA1CA_3923 [Olavius algarvensis associated proteobacterium Delta 3]|nr:hypothetical protein D3OALGB2SA_2129 [Olavius algarvensis associated proteobacterium Delta 3]CAB5142285.1 hypothetical protein D3OALGA1CA_3923 [Olavius algarvensis associated proteobacterium Delta 3]
MSDFENGNLAVAIVFLHSHVLHPNVMHFIFLSLTLCANMLIDRAKFSNHYN